MTLKVRLALIRIPRITAKPSKSHKGPCYYIIIIVCGVLREHVSIITIFRYPRVCVHCIITREVHNINAFVCVIYIRTSMCVLIVVKWAVTCLCVDTRRSGAPLRNTCIKRCAYIIVPNMYSNRSEEGLYIHYYYKIIYIYIYYTHFSFITIPT